MSLINQIEKLPPKGNRRRDFFKLAAAGGASFAVASCASDPVETMVPFLNPPSDLVSGEFIKFATTCAECAAGCGVIGRTREGRLINLEGNKKNPISKGGLCAIGQSAVQGHYSPSRAIAPQLDGTPVTWAQVDKQIGQILSTKFDQGKAVFIKPAMKTAKSALIEQFARNFGIEVINFETNPYQSLIKANIENFDQASIPSYAIDQAKTLLVFGADFLESWHSVVENSRSFAEFRANKDGKKGLYYHFSPHLSLSAANADKWYSCSAGKETDIVLALCQLLLEKTSLSDKEKSDITKKLAGVSAEKTAAELKIPLKVLRRIANEFGTNGTGLAISGGLDTSNAGNSGLQQATNLLNYLGGSINKLVRFDADYAFAGDQLDRLQQVLQNAAAGKVDLLIIDNVNLFQSWPDKTTVEKAIRNTKHTIGFFTNHDETSALCRYVLPQTTAFESWNWVEAKKSVIGLQQPVMLPLPNNLAQAAGDVLLRWAKVLAPNNQDFAAENFQAYVQQTFAAKTYQGSAAAFASFWVKSLMQGGHYGPTNQTNVAFRFAALPASSMTTGKTDNLAVVTFNSNLRNANARTSNRNWLDEIGNPISQVCWNSWVEIHPQTAARFAIEHGDEVTLSNSQGSLNLTAYVYHGVHPDTLAVPAGWGQSVLFPSYSARRGLFTPFSSDEPKTLKQFKVGENVADLLPVEITNGDLLLSTAVGIKKTGKKTPMATYDGQWRDDLYAIIDDSEARYGDRSQKGRGMYRRLHLDGTELHRKEHALHDRSFQVKEGTPFDFYKPVEEQVKPENVGLGLVPNQVAPYHEPYRFEMVIDLDRCTGCSACVVACYAENNIPVVGQERVRFQRQMNWIRIERYFDRDLEGNWVTNLGPNLCQHCSNAGCEPVCPVYATYHNPDGLNAQIYNRCVGTRYCANNCIYKLRRFNWRTYEFPYPLNVQLNPDVQVRSKGVMEKCTFCVQRISRAKYVAKSEERLVRDGEIVTACQSVCPTQAIAFGNSADKGSEVSRLKENKRSYHQLEEVNFKPALTYLSRTSHKVES